MATYYVDYNGNVSSSGAPSSNKKKKKKQDNIAYSVGANGKVTKLSAPTTKAEPKATTNKSNERTWFQKSKGNLLQTIAGTGVDVLENAVSSIGTIGESAIDAMAYFSSGAYASQKVQNGGMLTQDDFDLMRDINEESSKFIKKDLYDEEKIAKTIISAPIKNATGIDAETMSVFGEKTDSLVQSGAQLLATAGLQAVGVPWFVTTGMTSFGGEAENALNQGATFGEAGGSALISAGAEILTEKLSGGIKFGGKTLDDALLKPLTEKIANKTLRTLTKVGMDAVGEGSEEIISQVFSNLGTSLYREENIEELLTNEEAFDSYLESFIGGSILGGGASSIRAIKSAKNGTDYVTGLSDNETKVVEKEIENRIKEKEVDGKKLTDKEKSKIRENVIEALDKGYISIDTIESALGGETYQQYQKQSEYQEQLEKELAELDNIKTMEMTGAQVKRKAEIEKILKEFDETNHVGSIKERLSTEVSGLAQNSRLAESYNERTRKGQAFEADLSKYEAKQAEAVKRAVESGILNNTNRTHDFVDMISKISAEKGVFFDFTNNQRLKESGFAVDGKQVNGFVSNGNITLNIDSAKSLESVVGHEILHVVKGTDIYPELQNVVKELATTKGEYQTRYDALKSLYEGVENANIEEEVTADLIGDYLFTDSDFVNRLSAEKPNIFKKIYEEIKYLYKVATAGSKELRELEKVKRTFEKAYKESGKSESGIKYSMTDASGKQLTQEQQEYFKDSKIRDENGNLKVMYHGSPASFTQFDKKKAKSSGYYGSGFYFSESESHASQYGSKYEVYLNIKNPMQDGQKTITKEQLRKFIDAVAENEDYGIENYGYGATVDSITEDIFGKDDFAMITDINATCIGDMVEAIQLFNEVNGTNYDGIIVPTETVAFYPEQIKNVDNTNPTSSADIRFSLSEVGTHNSLMAIHNLSADKMKGILELGAFPVPSIAIINDSNVGNLGYGEISVLLDKKSIDPKDKRNEVYGSDVYSKRFPKAVQAVNDNELSKLQEYLGATIDVEDTTLENAISKYKSRKEFIDKFIEENSIEVELVYKEVGYNYINGNHDKTRNFVIENDITFDKLLNDKELRNEFYELYRETMPSFSGFTEKKIARFEQAFNEGGQFAESVKSRMDKDFYSVKNGAEKQLDTYETENKRRSKVLNDYTEQYTQFMHEKLAPVFGEKYIRNKKDTFLPSGNRRSFKQLYDPYTLDNIMKNMLGKVQGEEGFFYGAGNIRSNVSPRFGSIADIKDNESKLISSDDFKQVKEQINEKLDALTKESREYGGYEYDSYAHALNEISQLKTITLDKAKKIFADYNFKMPDSIVQKSLNFLEELKNAPTEYFEAKPQRAVGLDEVQAVVIPSDTDSNFKKQLTDAGLYVVEYDSSIEGDKEAKINQFDDLKFSLSSKSNASKEYGNRNTYGKDIALESELAPVQETAQEEVQEVPTSEDNTTFRSVEDYAPLTEEDANNRDDAQIKEHYFMDDMSPEVEEGYSGEFADHVKPYDPFYEKDIWEVGKDRKQKAYMYENPEVKPFFQQEARYMLGELDRSQKGEKFYNDQLYYDTGGEYGWFGTKRYTSEDIAYLLDTFNYTYKDIAKGLNAIIEDNGKENNAISKRIEFLLDERLRLGYKDFYFGDKVPPNQDYINLLNEKQIMEYNDDAWNNWLRSLTEEDIQQYANVEEEVAPLPQDYVAVEKAPVKAEEKAEEVKLYDAQKRKGVVEGQQSMFEEAETPKTITRSNLHENIINNMKASFETKGFDLDKVLKGAKNLSTFATVDNTPQRVMEKALGYKQGQILSDLTVNQVAQNETKGIQWLDSFTNRKKGVLAQISKQYNIKAGSKESAGAQMYAEGFYVDENNNIIKYGDAELAKDFPDAKVQANIKGLANDARIRQIYDETLKAINESRTRNAYPEIPRLDNYFLHFRAMDDTFSRLGLPFNPNDIRAKDLPTDLNGVTADLKPGQPYFASAMHRTGKRTSFDLLGGLERYLTSAKNQIYHIDDIQTLRALRNYIADEYGQAKGLESIDSMSEEEAQERISQVYNSHLSTFAKFLNEEANILAGKTALIDRGLEGTLGRRAMTFLDTLNRQVGSNMVGFNLSSSLTNFLPVAQTFAKTNKADFVKAFSQTVSNKVGSIFGKSDGFAEQSPVMIRRKGADRFYRTPFQKFGDAGYVLMSAVDDISTELITRTKYNELVKGGMDAQQAHFETDKWVSRLMGDRSLGQQPQLYNSKTFGLITKFQLEVRNQLDSQFYDTIQEAKVSNEHIQNGLERNAKIASKVTSTLVQLAVVQHLFGKAFESVAGYNPAFDIIEVLLTTFGFDDEEDSEDTALDNIEQGFLTLVGDLPYTSTLTGGRIPISSALPVEELFTGKDEYGNDKSRLETLREIAPYYVLPTGYGQIKKTKQGLGMFDDDLPVSGSYTDSGNLRFPVEDTLANRVQAGVFGQYASANARDYFDNERSPLKEKQIQEYADLDLPIRDYWEYREGLAKQEDLEDKFEYINSLDVSNKQKNIMINNVVDRKEKVDMSNYDDFANYEEFDFYTKNKEKYNFLQENGVSYSEYKADKDTKEEYDSIYSWWKNNPEKVTVSKAVTSNVIEYRRYAKELNDIRADKDSNGDSISGSAKRKKLEYINNLDLDYGQRVILYRTIADSKEDKNRYNPQIVEYLDSREDITWEEMKTILEELDMKVNSDGTISW